MDRGLDARLAVIFEGTAVRKSEANPQFYACADCGCVYWPEDDGEAVFTDRYTPLREHGDRLGCPEPDCACHKLDDSYRKDG